MAVYIYILLGLFYYHPLQMFLSKVGKNSRNHRNQIPAVRQNNIGAPKMLKKCLCFQYCDSNIGPFLFLLVKLSFLINFAYLFVYFFGISSLHLFLIATSVAIAVPR